MKSPSLLLLLAVLYSSQGRLLGNPRVAQTLLSDRRLVLQQIDCVLGRGRCDNIGFQLKVAIPEVLLRNCRACSPQQAESARKIINHLKQNYPNEWSQIQRRYTH